MNANICIVLFAIEHSRRICCNKFVAIGNKEMTVALCISFVFNVFLFSFFFYRNGKQNEIERFESRFSSLLFVSIGLKIKNKFKSEDKYNNQKTHSQPMRITKNIIQLSLPVLQMCVTGESVLWW